MWVSKKMNKLIKEKYIKSRHAYLIIESMLLIKIAPHWWKVFISWSIVLNKNKYERSLMLLTLLWKIYLLLSMEDLVQTWHVHWMHWNNSLSINVSRWMDTAVLLRKWYTICDNIEESSVQHDLEIDQIPHNAR